MRVVYVTLQGHQLSEITIRVIQSSSGACHVIIMTAENSQKRGFYRVLPSTKLYQFYFQCSYKWIMISESCPNLDEMLFLKYVHFREGYLQRLQCSFFWSAEFFRNSMNGVIRCRTYLSMCPFAKKLWADQIFVTCKKVHTYFISTLFEWPTLESFGISSFSRVSTSLNNCILFFHHVVVV